MHQNTFLTTPDSKSIFFEKVSGGLGSMRKCIKTRFSALLTVKKIFFLKKFLVVGKYAQMHQNTFLTTSDSKKYLF
jgi:hypothetical protein